MAIGCYRSISLDCIIYHISLESTMTNNSSDSITTTSRSASTALAKTLSDPDLNFVQRYDAVRSYLDSLAKPVGSLGSIEDFAARLAALQRSATPSVDNPVCLIFAADHGVAKDKSEGGINCSSYPQAVSRKVLEALDHGSAGASVLARCNNAHLRVIDVGLADGPASEKEYEWSQTIVRSSEETRVVQDGTKNFCIGSAMSDIEVAKCILTGRRETRQYINEMKSDIVIFGEVGIGNTTTSSALIAALCGIDVKSLCGTGASITRDGIDDDVVNKKITIIEEAMAYHNAATMLKGAPLPTLAAVGGAEIAAIVGGILEATDRDIPILVDGFIVTTAAMIACQIDPDVTRNLLFATQSTEQGQTIALNIINDIAKAKNDPAPAQPALNMNLRMGEGTGALMAVPLLRSACAVLAELATLNEVLSL